MTVDVNLNDAYAAIRNDKIDLLPWAVWMMMPNPNECRSIIGPKGPGIYLIRNSITKENIQFGIGIKCQERMKSLFPKPYGKGTRNNTRKREFILKNWMILEYRTLATINRPVAKKIEDCIKSKKNHLFNT